MTSDKITRCNETQTGILKRCRVVQIVAMILMKYKLIIELWRLHAFLIDNLDLLLYFMFF